MKLRPLHDRIVIKRIEEGEKKSGGIIIPDSAKEKPQEGEVIAVGSGKRLEDGRVVPLDLKIGDRVLFGKYSGSEIKLEGEEYIIMREDEVLAAMPRAFKLKQVETELEAGAAFDTELPGDSEIGVDTGGESEIKYDSGGSSERERE